MMVLFYSPKYPALKFNTIPNTKNHGQMIMKKRKLTTLTEVLTLTLPRKYSYLHLTYTYVQTSTLLGSACNDPRGISCAKLVEDY